MAELVPEGTLMRERISSARIRFSASRMAIFSMPLTRLTPAFICSSAASADSDLGSKSSLQLGSLSIFIVLTILVSMGTDLKSVPGDRPQTVAVNNKLCDLLRIVQVQQRQFRIYGQLRIGRDRYDTLIVRIQ